MNISNGETMKSIIIKKKKEIEIIHTNCEAVRAGQVRIKMIACGICGTDKHFYFESETPITFWGHEAIGIVVECGEDVSEELLNKFVVTKATVPCEKCYHCKIGQKQSCQKFSRYKYNGFSEYIVIPLNLVVILPIEKFKIEYVLTEPLYVALDIVKKIPPDKKCKILVSGLGTIGLLTLFLLNKYGFQNVFCYNRSTYEMVNRKLIYWKIREPYHDISKIKDKYDVIINTAPYYTIPSFIPMINYNGTLIFNGIHSVNNVLLDLHIIHFNKISLLPSFPHPQESFQESINIITKYADELNWMITHSAPIEESYVLFSSFENKKQVIIKAIITNDEIFKKK